MSKDINTLKKAQARKYLNKYFPQTWGSRWKDSDTEVKMLSKMLTLKNKCECNTSTPLLDENLKSKGSCLECKKIIDN